MSLRVSDWYHSVKRDEVSLVAGKAGLNRHVYRVHVVEKADFSTFLEGSEIIFITGVALSRPQELLEIVENCFHSGIVGAVVNLGSYIKALPPEVIAFCDRVDLPLFTVPWHVHIEALMQKVFQMVADADSNQRALETAALNAIQFPDRQELYVHELHNQGFAPEWRYCVALAQSGGDLPADRVRPAARRFLEEHGLRAISLMLNQTLVILFANYSSEDVEERMRELCGALRTEFSLPQSPLFAVGRCTKSVRCIQKSHTLAEKILTLQLRGQLPEELHAYNNLGVYKIVIGLENQDVLSEIREEYLEPLLAYDKACGTDYTAFIRSYLKYDGQVQDISEKMFIHRNTVYYKIRKVEEILDCDLQRTDTKMYLLIATMSYQLGPGK